MFLLRFVIVAFAILVATQFIPGIQVASPWTALAVAIVLGLLNVTVRPVLLILSLPLTIITLGLFVFVVNAAVILLAGKIVAGFVVAGFLSALILSLFLTVVNWFVSMMME